MNLVVNARDAMPSGGTLTLQTANSTVGISGVVPPGRYVTFRVTDTGLGMTEEVKAHIFEPFFTTKPVVPTVGLATCFGIINQSAGHITVDSELHRGSTFTVWLPAIDSALVAAELKEVQAAAPRGTERILLVEDEEVIRELAALELRELGYAVRTARNGEEALEILRATGEPVELLVTDVVMPKMGGAELADALRRQSRETRVLFTPGTPRTRLAGTGCWRKGSVFCGSHLPRRHWRAKSGKSSTKRSRPAIVVAFDTRFPGAKWFRLCGVGVSGMPRWFGGLVKHRTKT